MKNFFLIFLFFIQPALASNEVNYKIDKNNGHIIHIVSLDPKNYNIELVKAHDSVFGREKLDAIAKRNVANIAINAGFFEMTPERNGMPTYTFIMDGNLLGLTLNKPHDLLIIDQNKLSFINTKIEFQIKINNRVFDITKVNDFAKGESVILFNKFWGNKTLSVFNERKEIIFNKDYKILAIKNNGNNEIGGNNFVLSLPKSVDITDLKENDKVEFILKPNLLNNKISAIRGVPQLIKNGEMNQEIYSKTDSFYTANHARTAIGINKVQEIIIIVAENHYTKPIGNITYEEIGDLIKDKNLDIYKTTLRELRKIIQETFSDNTNSKGLTIVELAEYMKKLGCENAINLDGGGSSTLFLNDKIMNESYGDEDEAMGRSTIRPIADALIFKIRN